MVTTPQPNPPLSANLSQDKTPQVELQDKNNKLGYVIPVLSNNVSSRSLFKNCSPKKIDLSYVPNDFWHKKTESLLLSS